MEARPVTLPKGGRWVTLLRTGGDDALLWELPARKPAKIESPVVYGPFRLIPVYAERDPFGRDRRRLGWWVTLPAEPGVVPTYWRIWSTCRAAKREADAVAASFNVMPGPVATLDVDDHGTLDQCDSPDDPDECAAMRERLVAGTNAPIPACPIHGEWTGED